MNQDNIEQEVKLSLTKEAQARIFPNVSVDSVDEIQQRLTALFLFAGYTLTKPKRCTNIDEYYDTANLGINGCNSTLRVRHTNDGYILTVKKPLERRTGTFIRDEDERIISLEEYKNLRTSNFQSELNKHFPELKNQLIYHIVTVQNNRIETTLSHGSRLYKLAIDCLIFIDPQSNEKSRNRLEIEIEARGLEAASNLDKMKNSLCDIYPEFVPSNKTKYEAAISYINGTLETEETLRNNRLDTPDSSEEQLQEIQAECNKHALFNRILISFIFISIGLGLIFTQPWLWPSKWLDNHPNRLGLYGCTIVIVIALAWAIVHRKGRNYALTGVAVGAGLVLLQIIGN